MMWNVAGGSILARTEASAKVLTTFMSYGSVAGERQADILNELLRKTVDGVDSGEPDETTIRRVLGYLHKKAS
jgi:hypothetical protein